MNEPRRARIERIIIGVIAQAFADAGTNEFVCDDRYATQLCRRAGGSQGDGLRVSGATKTELLLGAAPSADVYPLGDLYASQLAELGETRTLAAEVAELASVCGGTVTLDRVLQSWFDQRQGRDDATASLTPDAAALLERRLDAARFRRTRVGLVPKIGARTLGIDLYA